MFGEGLWGVVVIGGPIVLALAILWAVLNNRTSRREDRITEEGTRRMQREQAAEDRARDGH